MKRDVNSFHEARWAEPLIVNLSSQGERGVFVPHAEGKISRTIGDPFKQIPHRLRRQNGPRLPEVSQARVLRHYMRLSQMCLGVDVAVDMMGTCTMKYSPKINEVLACLPEVQEIHPLQSEETIQGLLELLFTFGRMMAEIAGMDEVTFQAGSGAQGIYSNAKIIKQYHRNRGEDDRRIEIITTAFSHPIDAAAPAVAGHRVITLMPGPKGYPEVDALKAALSDRTAGFMLANPEDTGLFNPHIKEMVDLVHVAGGLCAYDQANANGVLGVIRAGDLGFDLCQFNLHKTFSAPHSSMGQGCAAVGVKSHLTHLLPKPLITFDGRFYHLQWDRPEAIDKIKDFFGNVQTVLKAYMWTRSLGAKGLLAVAQTAVLNSNYLLSRLRKLRGITIPWPEFKANRLEQVRYSMERLHEDTGVSSLEVNSRLPDYGMPHFIESHVPMLVPQPFTLEPGESYTLDELDECVEIFERIVEEAYSKPELIKTAAHRAAISRLNPAPAEEPQNWAMTWRAYLRKKEANAREQSSGSSGVEQNSDRVIA